MIKIKVCNILQKVLHFFQGITGQFFEYRLKEKRNIMKQIMNLLILCAGLSALAGCRKNDDRPKEPKKEHAMKKKKQAKKPAAKKSKKKSDKKMKKDTMPKKSSKGY